jgi:hypothetical protein
MSDSPRSVSPRPGGLEEDQSFPVQFEPDFGLVEPVPVDQLINAPSPADTAAGSTSPDAAAEHVIQIDAAAAAAASSVADGAGVGADVGGDDGLGLSPAARLDIKSIIEVTCLPFDDALRLYQDNGSDRDVCSFGDGEEGKVADSIEYRRLYLRSSTPEVWSVLRVLHIQSRSNRIRVSLPTVSQTCTSTSDPRCPTISLRSSPLPMVCSSLLPSLDPALSRTDLNRQVVATGPMFPMIRRS